MAFQRRSSRNQTPLAFDALAIEGGLLSPDWLARIAKLEAGEQVPTDYNVPKGLQIREEIGRYWRIAQAHWNDFASGLAAKGEPVALAERFVSSLLTDVFDFTLTRSSAPVVISERSYPLKLTALSGTVPVVVAPAGGGLDALDFAFGDVGRKRSAFGLAQEFLNASDDALWGVVSNGNLLRIVRDNASLTRPAWIEADLERIFMEDRFADFAALWLLAHETRFGRDGTMPADCVLETWRKAGREEGTRARDKLRGGVEKAVLLLGQGFIAHPDNNTLRAALESGELTKDAYFQQLLRLVYRFIFLLTVEERDLLHPEGTPEAIRKLYAEGYGLKRLRDRAVKRSAHDRFNDLWEATKIVFRGTATGEARLGLPALAGLFASEQCVNLDGAKLENRALSGAMFHLSWLREATGLARVNWRDMGPEELGSVYEGLLELVPVISVVDRRFEFAKGDETKGNARKTSGSYYTPDSLVQVLLDSALEPVVKNVLAKQPNDKEAIEAILSLSVVDPACGSGHFLLGAARRLAAHVARLAAGGTPSSAQYRHALRQVVGRCIYGVDLNPMAVELCKVALWMEALEPGKPLTFLDSHIQHGNALLGTTPELMAKGVPDEAWVALEGDDKKTTSALKKKNKAGQGGQAGFEALWSKSSDADSIQVKEAMRALEQASDADLAALSGKHEAWTNLRESEAFRREQLVADTWCAAFVWPKPATSKDTVALIEATPVDQMWRQIREGRSPELTVKTTARIAAQYHFFHWHLAFPLVFEREGFDVVLGNPPWERIKLQELEFFASHDEAIISAKNAAARKKLIAALSTTNPQLWDSWGEATRESEGQSHFVRQSGRYPLCAKGDVNTYALFAEHNRSVLGPKGRAGFIVPTGIATDDTTKDYFAALVAGAELAKFYSFENEEFVFPGVHHAFRFALLIVSRAGDVKNAELVFFARQVAALADPERQFSLAPQDFALLNPNTRTCPTFRSRKDADLNLAMYRRAGVLWREADEDIGNPWGLRFMRMLDMANDSGLFRSRSQVEESDHAYLPLVEAKMVHLFDHRFGTYEGQTQAQQNQSKLPELDDDAHANPNFLSQSRYWVAETEVTSRLDGRWNRGWLLGWRDITNATNMRTVVASLIPVAGTGDTVLLALSSEEPTIVSALYANLCSFGLDYAARQKVGGTHLKYHTFKQLPVLPPSTYKAETPWHRGTTLADWILPRVLELTYTAWDLEPFAKDVGYDGPPFRWDPDRRFLLRCELDAAFFHLYGLAQDDTGYVLDTFPIVRKNEEKEHGEFRTRRVVLKMYEEMADAARSGTAYVTKLVPGPADVAVAHPARAKEFSFPRIAPSFPNLNEDLIRFVWAMIHAGDGVIERTTLARAYALRTQPSLLSRKTTDSHREAVDAWMRAVASRPEQTVRSAISRAIKDLEGRSAIRFGIRDGASTVERCDGTPTTDKIGEWHVEEARLLLNVLSTIGVDEQQTFEAGLTAEDQAMVRDERRKAG